MAATATFTLEAIDNASKVINGAAGALDSLGDLVGGAFNVALAAGAAGATALAGGLAFAIGQAIEGEATLAKLSNTIEATGGAAGVTVGEAQALAEQFMNLAGGSDDAVLSIIDMGLKMGTVSEEEMPGFIQSVLDLGTVMGDTTKAAQVLARAQEDPIGTLGILRKNGILLTEQQEDQIKTMQEAGDTAGAYALLMENVAEVTGGAAAANAATLAGQIEIFKGQLGEAAETIGTAFLPLLHELFDNVITPAIPIISQLAEGLGLALSLFMSGEEDIRGSADALAEFANDVIPGSADVIRDLGGTIQGFVDGIVAGLPAAQAAIQPVIDAAVNLASQFIASMPMIQASVQGMVDFVIGQFNTLSPTIIANVSSTLNSIAEFWTAHGDTIMATVSLIWDFIVVTIGVTITAISGIIAAGLELINGDTAGALDVLQTTFTTIMDSILSIVGTDLETFVADWTGTLAMVDDIVNIGLATIGNAILEGLNAAITGAQTTLQGFADLGTAIIDGIVSSIQSGAASVVNAMLGMLQDAIDAAQSVLGIQSPSKVFAEIGKQTMAGMAQGIDRYAMMPSLAMTDSASQLYGSARNTTNYYNMTINTPAPYNIGGALGRQRALAGAY